MRRIILVLFVLLAACSSDHASFSRCEEDMSCWNCHTMGNHICGSEMS